MHSVIECMKCLLAKGMEFVLTERFSQDCVGCRSDNPSISQIGHNDNVVRIQSSVVSITGNTRGAHESKRHVSLE